MKSRGEKILLEHLISEIIFRESISLKFIINIRMFWTINRITLSTLIEHHINIKNLIFNNK